MPTGNSSYSKLITTTLQHHGDKIFDAVSTNVPLLYLLKEKGNIKVVGGGRSFTHPVLYKQNSSFGSYAKLDTIPTPLMDDITRANYPIKIIAGSLVISDLELAMNAGNKEQLIKLTEETKLAAEISMTEILGSQVYNAGTAANDFDGIQNIISDDQDTACGEITPSATNTYWRPYVYSTTISAFNTSDAGLIGFNTVLNSTTYGRQGPKAVLTTKAIYQLYELSLTPNVRYSIKEVGDAGFRNLAYATMPVIFDDNCPASHTYFVDTDSLWLQVLKQGNMKQTNFMPSQDQLTSVALMYFYGNLTAGSRRTQGVLTDITG